MLCLVAGDKRCSLNKIKKILNEKDVSMGNADQVKEITGFTIGGVSPIGHLKPIKIFIDESLSRFPNIFGAAGHPNCVFKIDFENLQKITNGEINEIFNTSISNEDIYEDSLNLWNNSNNDNIDK